MLFQELDFLLDSTNSRAVTPEGQRMKNHKGNGYDAVEVVRTAITLCTEQCGWSLEVFCIRAGAFANARHFDVKKAAQGVEQFLGNPTANFDRIPAPVIALSNWAVTREPRQIEEKFRNHTH